MYYTLYTLTPDHKKQSVKIPIIEIESRSYSKNTHIFIFYIYSERSLEITTNNDSIDMIIYNPILTDDILNDLRIKTSEILISHSMITKLINLFQRRHISINIEKHTNTNSANEVESMILHIYKAHGFEVTLINKSSNSNYS
jgi:hypothetical protein